jgi:ATP-dependent helicase/nuclease subunit B
VLAGLELGGATLTEFDEVDFGIGSIGHAVWSPSQLLRDLELRLGLGRELESEALRVARWSARMAELAPLGRFYSRSFDVDSFETARSVLRLRDALVEAGWAGQPIPHAGPRLAAIHELDHLPTPVLPSGYADRLATVERRLVDWRVQLYSELYLAESLELWPQRWQRIFGALERASTSISQIELTFPGAPRESDLGKVQAALTAGRANAAIELRGDGTLTLLTAETSWEAAAATAAILNALPEARTVVIREDDVSPLDNALATHGARTQGWRSTSPWRSALQVMPLALELAFDPKDPERVLELLTLPVGPFPGFVGRRLAEALMQSPGIGSPAWEEAKSMLARGASERAKMQSAPAAAPSAPEPGEALLARIADWFEQRGGDPIAGAPKAALLGVIERVRAWLISTIRLNPEDAMLLVAARHSATLRAALESDPRPSLNLIEVRRLAESVLETGAIMSLIGERAGRIAHVDRASSMHVPRENVVWWSFVDSTIPGVASWWRRPELSELSRAGIAFPDPKQRLAERARAWRRPVLAATERVLLVYPRKAAGENSAMHPLWAEIAACSGAGERALRRVTVDARALRHPSTSSTLLASVPLSALEPAALPGGHGEWRVPSAAIQPVDQLSPASLESLLGCPLRWGLHYRAGINAGGLALPPLFLVNGALGHRLIELLHEQGVFALSPALLRERAESELDQLFEREGAILLRAGMSFERSQLRRQLVESALELARVLASAGLRIVEVEKPIEVSWLGRTLVGRIDLLVANEAGTQAIIDMKWGWSSYRELLKSGHALQLAVYSAGHAKDGGHEAMPEAAYFSLKQQKLFGLPSELFPHAETIAGPSLAATWQRIERSIESARQLVEAGRFPVTGVRQSLPLLVSFGIPESSHEEHFRLPAEASCKYCGFDAVCGRRWENAP